MGESRSIFEDMITKTHISQAVEILAKAACPEKIILFGSYARGEAREDSDLDFLVIEANPIDRYREMVRLRRALSPMRIPVDIVVKSLNNVDEWRNVPGTLVHEALNKGQVVYEKTH